MTVNRRPPTPFPSGFYSRIEPDRQNRLDVLRDPETADGLMVNITDLLFFKEIRLSAIEYLSRDRPLISTTTIHDRELERLPLVTELESVVAVGPHWHIPFDVPTYINEDMTPTKRAEILDRYCGLVPTIADFFEEAPVRTRILPLLKGVTEDELLACYDVIEPIAEGYIAVYVGQFFNSRVGRQWRKCRNYLRMVDSLCNPNGVLAIGLAAPKSVAKLPACVTAVAGARAWHRQTDHFQLSLPEARANVRAFRRELADALATGYHHRPLSVYTPGAEEVHG